jgi:hypothetical protein
MRKNLLVLFTVFVLLSISATNVLAASTTKHVSLISATYQDGGIVLIFETSGLTKADLKNNSFYADSNSQKMYCNFVDESTKVRCLVSKKLAGQGDFHVTLAGFGFWGQLPEARDGCDDDEVEWYSLDEYIEGEYNMSGDIPAWLWDFAKETGWLDELASAGVTYTITDEFCGPAIELES